MFICLDTETGGLDPKRHTLLTASFRILDADLRQVDGIDLFIAPDEEYRVTAGALQVNRIDILDHSRRAVSPLEARLRLIELLDRWAKPRLTPIGHNIMFDLNFIHEHLLPKHEWEARVSYRVMDTQVIALFLQLTGKLKASSSSLMGLALSLGVPQKAAHTAADDAEVTAEVFRRLVMLGKESNDFGGPVS
jgi:DNA polymerase III alpha subunit (gram-positive type)